MGAVAFLALMIAAAGTAVAVMVRATAEVARLRRRLRGPRPPVSSLREGQRATVAGVIERGPERTAPLSGRSCVTWLLAVHPNHADAGRSIRIQRGGDVVIRDGDGLAVVDTDGADLWFERSPTSWIGGLDERPALAAVLGPELARDPAWSPTTRVTCYEWLVAVGDELGAYGQVRFEADPTGAAGASSYRDSFAQRVRLVGEGRQRVVVAELPSPR